MKPWLKLSLPYALFLHVHVGRIKSPVVFWALDCSPCCSGCKVPSAKKGCLSGEVLLSAQLGSAWIASALLLGWAGIWWRALTLRMLMPDCLQMGPWGRFWGRLCFPRDRACFPKALPAVVLLQSSGSCPGSHPRHIPVSECPVVPQPRSPEKLEVHFVTWMPRSGFRVWAQPLTLSGPQAHSPLRVECLHQLLFK